MMNKTIVIMAGGTGGHVFPGLAVAEALQEKGWQVVWLGTKAGIEAQVIPEAGFTLVTLPVTGLRGHRWQRWLKAPFILLSALWGAIKTIRRYKPVVVLGMGGFASGPGGLAAWLMRVPLVIHEQNAVVGITNKLLAPLAWRICEGFPGAFPHTPPSKVLYTGNPLRDMFVRKVVATQIHEKPPLTNEPKRLLVLGGSRGAHALNQAIPSALGALSSSTGWTVWHQTGEKERETVAKAYESYGIAAKVDAFITHIHEAYVWADFVICRAGALTVAELAAVGVASLLIPYPYAVDDHQGKNAQYLVDKGAAWLLRQSHLNEEAIHYYLKQLQQTPQCCETMAAAARACAQLEATKAVVTVCEEAPQGKILKPK